jgi:lipopolysaccharide export system permease protein
MRTQFSEQLIRFDLMAFKMSRTDEDMFKDNYQMLNLKQLDEGIDTMYKEIDIHKIRIKDQVARNIQASPSSLDTSIARVFKDTIKFKFNNFISNFKKEEQLKIYETASNIARSNSSYIVSSQTELELFADSINRYRIEWNKKFTLSFACIILFFIGAPLGAIIKKGGLGMPVVVSVGFFLVFHVLSITGEKFAKEGVIPAYQGIWLASAVLLPFGIFLTYKATADSTLFDMENYISFFKRIFKKKKK